MAVMAGAHQPGPQPPPQAGTGNFLEEDNGGGEELGRIFEGTIKSFDEKKGFGFIRDATLQSLFGCDAFVHHKQMNKFEVGHFVRFRVRLNQRRQPQAYGLVAAEASQAQLLAAMAADSEASSFLAPSPPQPPQAAAQPSQPAPQPAPVEREQTPPLEEDEEPRFVEQSSYTGRLSSFNWAKGFGFIHERTLYKQFGVDVYVHHTQVGDASVGDDVTFGLRFTSKRELPVAFDVARSSTEGAFLAPLEFDFGHGNKGARGSYDESAWSKLEGNIKFFDETKGYGFIVCPQAQPLCGCADIFVHQSHLNGFALGDRVGFTLKQNKKSGKFQAQDLVAAPNLHKGAFNRGVYNSDASDMMAPVSAAGENDGDDDGGLLVHTGRLKSFDPGKNFGFIHSPEVFEKFGHDVFIHGRLLTRVLIGEQVRFSMRFNKKGLPQVVKFYPSAQDASPSVASGGGAEEGDHVGITGDGRLVHSGYIKMIDEEKGFGFIHCRELREAYTRNGFFASKEQLAGFAQGDNVLFTLKPGKQGKMQVHTIQPAAEQTPESVPEVKIGIIKSFDPDRGYGFISSKEVTEQYDRDVFLHSTQIKHFRVGDVVAFTITINKGNPQASNLHEASPEMSSQVSRIAPEVEAKVVDSEEEFVGEIKSYSSAHHYGYISCTKLFDIFGRDTYIHEAEYNGLSVADEIRFQVKVKEGRPKAHSVVKILTREGQPEGGDASDRGTGAGARAESKAIPAGSSSGSSRASPAPPLAGLTPEELNRKLLRACASARVQSVDEVGQLLAARADTQCRDVTGQSALMICALNVRHGERKCRLLIEQRADPTALANDTQSVVQWVRERVNSTFASFLEAIHRGESIDYTAPLDRPGGDEF